MECTVKWIGDSMSFLAETGSKHALVMDAAADAGGRNLAPRPMEMLLAGTGGCTAFDVVSILKKDATQSAVAKSVYMQSALKPIPRSSLEFTSTFA